MPSEKQFFDQFIADIYDVNECPLAPPEKVGKLISIQLQRILLSDPTAAILMLATIMDTLAPYISEAMKDKLPPTEDT